MAKSVRVPIHRTSPTQTVQVEVGATVGAQIGVNLLMPDGSLVTTAKLQALFGDGTPSDGSINTTDDLEEGQWNLWFTDRRAQDAVGGILADTATIDLAYTAGTSITATLKDLADSGTGTLQAVTFDAKGRKTGSRAATITGTAGRVTVAHGDASDGLPTIDLATVADAGGGTLQRTAFDAYGRKTGTSAATTTDLTEGANLYFTNARVRATALTGLSTATATPVTATDSVLVGVGKLQGQASAAATAIAGKEPSITPGTTAQYWRGDKTWRDFATDVRAAVLTGLSTATSAVIAATDTVLGALGKLQAQITAGDTRTQTALDRSGFKNLIINGDFAINQRVFSGGALAAGAYGYDRWKAGASGCTVSLSGGTLTHTSGSLVQIMEAPGIAGQTITVSVEDPSGSIGVDVDGATGTITAGSGRRGVAISVPSGSTGNVTLTITATAVTYKRVQVELGPAPTAWLARPAEVELGLCQRYYEKSYDLATPAGTVDAFNGAIVFWNPNTSGNTRYPVTLAVQKRVPPTVTLYSLHTGAANAVYNNSAGSDITSFAVGSFVGQHGFIAGCANPLAVNEMRLHFTADAEL